MAGNETWPASANPPAMEEQALEGREAKSRIQAVEEAKAAVRNMADAQKSKVAARLGGVAQALHDTAKTLERQNSTAGHYADLAARQVDRVSQALGERGIDELVGDAEEFARRQPWVFIGGALMAGFALARFVKSGNEREMAGMAQDVGEKALAVVRETGEAMESAPPSEAAAGSSTMGAVR